MNYVEHLLANPESVNWKMLVRAGAAQSTVIMTIRESTGQAVSLADAKEAVVAYKQQLEDGVAGITVVKINGNCEVHVSERGNGLHTLTIITKEVKHISSDDLLQAIADITMSRNLVAPIA